MIDIPAKKKISDSKSHKDLEDMHKKLTTTHDKISKNHENVQEGIESIKAMFEELIEVFKKASESSLIEEKLSTIIDQNKQIYDMFEYVLGKNKEKNIIGTPEANQQTQIISPEQSNVPNQLGSNTQQIPGQQMPVQQTQQVPQNTPQPQPQVNTAQGQPPNSNFEFPDFNEVNQSATPNQQQNPSQPVAPQPAPSEQPIQPEGQPGMQPQVSGTQEMQQVQAPIGNQEPQLQQSQQGDEFGSLPNTNSMPAPQQTPPQPVAPQPAPAPGPAPQQQGQPMPPPVANSPPPAPGQEKKKGLFGGLLGK